MSATADPLVATSASTTADAALQAISGAAGQDVTFSLELSQDQKDIRDWVHGFAADVVRPAAHEWDEREETPWPIIQEAAKIGLYGFEGHGPVLRRPERARRCRSSTRSCSGATPASACRSWARRWPSRRSSGRAPASRSANGFRAASARSTSVEGRGLLRIRAQRRLGRLGRAHDARSSTRPPASGCSTARRPGRPTAASPTSTW